MTAAKQSRGISPKLRAQAPSTDSLVAAPLATPERNVPPKLTRLDELPPSDPNSNELTPKSRAEAVQVLGGMAQRKQTKILPNSAPQDAAQILQEFTQASEQMERSTKQAQNERRAVLEERLKRRQQEKVSLFSASFSSLS